MNGDLTDGNSTKDENQLTMSFMASAGRRGVRTTSCKSAGFAPIISIDGSPVSPTQLRLPFTRHELTYNAQKNDHY